MNTTYTPRADSLAARCIAFFRANPDEELTLEDIADKFDAVRGNIHTLLAPAREAGLVNRYRNNDGEYIYTAGKQIAQADGVDIDAAHHGRAATPPVQRRTPVAAADLPNPLAVAIEDDVPIPGRRQKLDWLPLLKRLKVKQSAALPLAAWCTLNKAVTQAHKDQVGTFTMRRDAGKNTLRVWRTA